MQYYLVPWALQRHVRQTMLHVVMAASGPIRSCLFIDYTIISHASGPSLLWVSRQHWTEEPYELSLVLTSHIQTLE